MTFTRNNDTPNRTRPAIDGNGEDADLWSGGVGRV